MRDVVRDAAIVTLAQVAREIMTVTMFLNEYGESIEERNEIMIVLATFDIAYMRREPLSVWDPDYSLDNRFEEIPYWAD